MKNTALVLVVLCALLFIAAQSMPPFHVGGEGSGGFSVGVSGQEL